MKLLSKKKTGGSEFPPYTSSHGLFVFITFRFSSEMYFHTPVMRGSSPDTKWRGASTRDLLRISSCSASEVAGSGIRGIGESWFWDRRSIYRDSRLGRCRAGAEPDGLSIPTHPPSRRSRQRRCECPGLDRTWRSGTAEGEQEGGSREDPSHTTNKG
jgi:hypothetical protein